MSTATEDAIRHATEVGTSETTPEVGDTPSGPTPDALADPAPRPKSARKSPPKSAAQPRTPAPRSHSSKVAGRKVAEPVASAARNGKPMVGTSSSDLVRSLVQPALLLQLVGHPARLGLMIMLMSEKSLHVNDLCGRLGHITQPALSHHLAIMRHSGILESTRRGKNVFYSLTPKGGKIAVFLQDFGA
jgi:DNA-binding transcriptional ArsR family regulator